MRRIAKSTPEQTTRLFEIMVQATQTACALSYPPDIIAIWHKGRSAEAMKDIIVNSEFYSIVEDGIVRGFVHFDKASIEGLFVHPDDHGKGYGTELFCFARDHIEPRPFTIVSTLNAIPFYMRMGCETVGFESIRRHDRDIYVQRMEYRQCK